MRLLVACPECRRQYDASGETPGARLRCHCGGEVVVQASEGHDARVVRCSSCGAPREEQAKACNYCSSDFTIHETDLHTVCPICLALVSDSARYCHGCGAPIVAEAVRAIDTLGKCPVCGPEKQLRSRRLGELQTAVSECQVCGGLWIDLAVFHHLLNAEEKGEHVQPLTTPAALDHDSSRRYRPCVVCGQFMGRRNFGGTSRVVVDLCGAHGIWFDANELAQLLAWMRAGGLPAAIAEYGQLQGAPAALRRMHQRANDPKKRPKRRAPGVLPDMRTLDQKQSDFWSDMIIEGVFRLFR